MSCPLFLSSIRSQCHICPGTYILQFLIYIIQNFKLEVAMIDVGLSEEFPYIFLVDYPSRIFDLTLQLFSSRLKHYIFYSDLNNKCLVWSIARFRRDKWEASQRHFMVVVRIYPSPYPPFPFCTMVSQTCRSI